LTDFGTCLSGNGAHEDGLLGGCATFRWRLRFHRARVKDVGNIRLVKGSRLLGAGGFQAFIVAISLGAHRGQVPGEALDVSAVWWVA
jgi:hypothetical protein